MDLFTYLMAKNDHNSSVNNDLFSCLLGKGQSGTYQTFTGTSISANNTKQGKMKLSLYGNTEQDSTTGKQEFNFSLMPSSIVVEENGKVIKPPLASSGNGYVSTYILLKNFCPNLQVGDTVYLYCDTNYDTQNKYIQLTGSGSGLWNFGMSKTLTEGDLNGGVAFYTNRVASGETSQLILTNFRITKTQDASWEEYTGGQPSPSPDFPQQIHEVSGDNTIEVAGKNLFDIKGFITSRGATYTENSDGSITLTTNYSTLYTQPYVFSDTEIDVALSGIIDNGTATNIRIQLLNNNNEVLGEITSSSSTTTKKASKLRFNWSTSGTFTLKDIMLNTGTTATTYEPYQSQTYPINLGVENLLPTNSFTLTRGTNRTLDIIFDTPLPAGTYTISWKVTNQSGLTNSTPFGWQFMGENNQSLGAIASIYEGVTTTYYTRIVTDKIAKIYCYINSGASNDATITLDEIQLEVGDKASSFTPYGTTPIWLGEISTYKDSFFKAVTGNSIYDNLDSATKETLDYGEWYLEKKIGKVVLDGTIISGYNSGNNWCYITFSALGITGSQDMTLLSNYFTDYTFSEMATDSQLNGIGAGSSYIVLRKNDLSSTTDYENWLSTNNTTVCYPLATPTYRKITGTLKEQLEEVWRANSYKGQTNISQVNDDLPFNLDVEVKVSS